MPQLRKEVKKVEIQHRAAAFEKSSINKEARTVDVVFATDAAIRMYVWGEGFVNEILSMEGAHVRLERVNAGAPILDNHNSYKGTQGVLGKVERAWIEDGVAKATIRFSKRADVEPIWQDVVDGIHSGISCGYRVFTYEATITEGSNELPEFRAIDWEPYEISLAPIPADINAGIRSDGKAQGPTHEVEIIYNNGLNKNDTIVKRELMIKLLQERQISFAENATDDELAALLERSVKPAPAVPTPAAQPAPVAAPVATATADNSREAVAAERQRVADITEAVRSANLGDDYAIELITAGHDVNKAREMIIKKFAGNDPNKGQRGGISLTADETDKFRSAMESALIIRANPNVQMTEQERSVARDFRGFDLMGMARECIERAGGSVRGLDKHKVAIVGLGLERAAGMVSTSDFPIILGNVINRQLRAEYAYAQPTFRQWTRQTTATDFREMTRVQLGELGSFEEVFEGGEYKQPEIPKEAKESYKIKKYGQIIAITWETLINDDLDAFSRMPMRIAQAAARKQSDLIYAILSGNPKMGDGVVLFHANHANLAGAGAAITIDSLAAGRLAIRKQTGIDGKEKLNLTPSFLLVGPDKEKEALQILSNQWDPAIPGNVNPYAGSLKLIVENRIAGNAWYLTTNTSQVDTVEYAFLEGEGELFTETRQGFKVDGVEVKARMTFGAKAIDFRGLYKNPGA